MKTIKTFVAAAAIALLALSNAQAGGFISGGFDALLPLPFPEELHRVTRCWPKWLDPRLIDIETSFLPRVQKCVVPFDPRAVDILDLGQTLAHNFPNVGQ